MVMKKYELVWVISQTIQEFERDCGYLPSIISEDNTLNVLPVVQRSTFFTYNGSKTSTITLF